MAKRKLSPQQLLFIDEYLRTSNATRAYILAYYTSKGKPEPKKDDAVRVNASKLLTNPNIAQAVDLQIEKKNKDFQIASPVEVLEGYTRALRFNPKLLYDDKKNLIPIPDLPDDIAMELVGIEFTDKGKPKYKFPDKTRVRDSMCKVFNIGQNGNGLKDLLLKLLENAGLNVTVNQTINNDLRTQIQYNTGNLQKLLPEADGTPSASK